MNHLPMFNAYLETLTPDILLMCFNSINYFLNTFFICFLLLIGLGAGGYAKKQYINTKILTDSKYGLYIVATIFALVLSILNKQYHIYFNNYSYLVFIILTTVVLFKNIERKSLKWFSVLLCIFIGCISFIYVAALYLIVNINTTGLEHFGIKYYKFIYKSLFKIYEFKDTLFMIDYSLNGKEVTLENNIVYKRIYIFYYFMNNIALLFWYFVYHKVLKFHGINLLKIMESKNNSND